MVNIISQLVVILPRLIKIYLFIKTSSRKLDIRLPFTILCIITTINKARKFLDLKDTVDHQISKQPTMDETWL